MNSGAIVKKGVAVVSIDKVLREAVTGGQCRCALPKFGKNVKIWKGA